MNRTVTDVNAYTVNASRDLVLVGRGVTHYRTAWEPGMSGDNIQLDLIAGGLPDTTKVTYDPENDLLDIAVLTDDGGRWSGTIESVVGLHIEGG